MGSQTAQSPFRVVDFTDENMKPGTDTWLSACHDVRTAFEEHGCFVARFDNISQELVESLISVLKEFFCLPMEAKTQKATERPFHGFIGKAPWLPMYESNGVDDPLNIDACQKFAHKMWPEGNDRFCEIINEYSKKLQPLDHLVKRLLFESYGVDMKRCDSFIESSKYLFRCLKYRPAGEDESTLGLQSHSDMSLISILHQLNNISGLEILMKDGEWKGIDASPNTFVVLAGDAFHVWSNGRIRTCEHRVIMNATEIRYAVGLFSFGGKLVEIPEELVDEKHPLRYKPKFDNYGYIRFFHEKRMHDVYSRIEAFSGL